MKKFLLTMSLVVTFFVIGSVNASAVSNDTVKVGLKYGSGALYSANLENAVGGGYSYGYYDANRVFVPVGYTNGTTVSVTAAGTVYLSSNGTYSASDSGSTQNVIGKWHVQLDMPFATFDEAAAAASGYAGAYPAYISDGFCVRIGSYASEGEAAAAMSVLGSGGRVVSGSSTGVIVTVTKSATVLFEFDCQGAKSLAILPNGQGEKSVTYFKNYKYYGGFEYNRITGGDLNVVNVVNLEDYVRCVIPYEMSNDWPAAALEAQAICARTYVCAATKHLSSYGFDVCNTTDCQVYYGMGGSSAYSNPTAATNAAVDRTAGLCIYANGVLANAVYFSSDGGATENAENVWGGKESHLIGKTDPYEATVSIPNYSYTTVYTPAQLTWVVQNSGYTFGTIRNVYVSEYTPLGNVYKVTFEDTSGQTLTVKGEKCRTIFYSTTYGKSVRSMRFTINGGSGGTSYYVNGGSNALQSVNGVSMISGTGTVSTYSGSAPYVITSSGTSALESKTVSAPASEFVITGTGSGHNVGMSQWGAYAMAQMGMTCQDILNFYYTDVTIG